MVAFQKVVPADIIGLYTPGLEYIPEIFPVSAQKARTGADREYHMPCQLQCEDI